MKLLITGAWRQAKEHIAEIEAMGHEVVFMQWENEEIPCDPAEIEGIVCNCLFLHHSAEPFTSLRYLQLISAGYDRVPMDYLKSHGVKVYNAGDTYATPMSEYIIGHLLALYQKNERDTDGSWMKCRDKQELTGKNVCIIGTGNVAQQTARKLQAFDCKVTAISNTPRELEHMDEVLSYDNLSTTLATSDIVVLATSPKGDHIIGASELATMKPKAVIVNVARGSLIDQKALTQALKNRTIQAAILDVFEVEPLPEDDELRQLDNAILTPHTSYVGNGNDERLWEVIKNNLEE